MKQLKSFINNTVNERMSSGELNIPRNKYVFMFYYDVAGTGGVVGFDNVSEMEDQYSAEEGSYDFLLKVKPGQVVEKDDMQYWRIK